MKLMKPNLPEKIKLEALRLKLNPRGKYIRTRILKTQEAEKLKNEAR